MPQRLAGGSWRPAGAIVTHRQPVRFRRSGGKGSHLVKVTVDAPHGRLEQRLPPDQPPANSPGNSPGNSPANSPGIRSLLDADLAVRPWQPGPADITGAQRLFALAADTGGSLAVVLTEGAALAMVASALRAAGGRPPAVHGPET